MARPKPEVQMSKVFDNNVFEVLDQDAIYAVLFKGKPFGLRTHHYAMASAKDTGQYNYRQTTFVNEGTAHLLARKMNDKFDTDDFTVMRFFPVGGHMIPTKQPRGKSKE